MRKPILAGYLYVAILALSILACAKATPEQIRKFTSTPQSTITQEKPTGTSIPILASTQTPILVESATPTPDRFYEISILAEALHVRDAADGAPTGAVLKKGDRVRAQCTEKWCELEAGGYVWRGCVSDNPDRLGCEQR